jgi:hypothetical protein
MKIYCKECKHLKTDFMPPTIQYKCRETARKNKKAKISNNKLLDVQGWLEPEQYVIRDGNCDPEKINKNNDCSDFKPLSLLDKFLCRQKWPL